MTARDVAGLRLRRTAAALLSPADVERIAANAEVWAEEERVRRIIARLDALHPATATAHANRVPCDWRVCGSEPTPNRAGDA